MRRRVREVSPVAQTIEIKDAAALLKMETASRLVGQCLELLRELVKPGISTLALDQAAFAFIEKHGAKPSFLGYHGYPATLCTSLNEEVVHGIPSADRLLAEGDVVKIDLGIYKDGYHGDAAISVPVGRIPLASRRLLEVTEEALECGIAQVAAGNRLGDVSAAVQRHVEEHGYSVVRDYVGHGIGRQMHEPPVIPNYGKPGTGPRLLAGHVLAIEPMVNMGTWQVETRSDRWTVVTRDGKLSAHFEHTVAVTEDGCRVLTRIG